MLRRFGVPAPIFLSNPYQVNGDKAVRQVNCINCPKVADDLSGRTLTTSAALDVEPLTGATLRAQVAIQINLFLQSERFAGSKLYSNISVCISHRMSSSDD